MDYLQGAADAAHTAARGGLVKRVGRVIGRQKGGPDKSYSGT